MRSTYPAPPVTLDKSVWEITAVPAPATSPLARSVRSQVAVIGAGYTGLTAALALAEHGIESIVVEAEDPGSGASGRNGGQVIPGLKHDPDKLLELLGEHDAQRLIDFAGGLATRTFELIHRYQLHCDASDAGWIQPALTKTQLATVTKRAKQWRRHAGLRSRLLDTAEAKKMTGAPDYVGGWIDPRGGQLQPLSYARELARCALDAGVKVYARSRATALSNEHGQWRLNINGHEIRAEQVIVATNAYSENLVPGLARSIFTAHSIQTATEPLPASIRREILPAGLPVSDARHLLNYMRFDPAGRFLIGARGSFGNHQPERYFSKLRATAVEMFPALAGVPWECAWGGRIALTVDHLPHIHSPAPGLYISLGYNGRGVALASQVGPLLANLCAGMSPEDLPLPITPVRRIPLYRQPAEASADEVLGNLERAILPSTRFVAATYVHSGTGVKLRARAGYYDLPAG